MIQIERINKFTWLLYRLGTYNFRRTLCGGGTLIINKALTEYEHG